MTGLSAGRIRTAFVVLIMAVGLAGCANKSAVTKVRLSERECLARAMYFESNRSSDDGMLAVGTVVMNRVNSGKYPKSICGVVGQRKQFAPGVLSRSMTDSGAPRARRMADAVLNGKRHSGVKNAMFFHTYGYKFPYRNMRYVLVAGGNAFYEKKKPPVTPYGEGAWPPPPPPSDGIGAGTVMVAWSEPSPKPRAREAEEPQPIVVASLEPQRSYDEPVMRRPAAKPRQPEAASGWREGPRPVSRSVEQTYSEPAPRTVAVRAPVLADAAGGYEPPSPSTWRRPTSQAPRPTATPASIDDLLAATESGAPLDLGAAATARGR